MGDQTSTSDRGRGDLDLIGNLNVHGNVTVDGTLPGGPPSGAAGGQLTGTYPNPGVNDTHGQSGITAHAALQASSQKGQANGYASLDSGILVPVAQLPVLQPSGGGHAAGIAPDPGNSAGSTKFLREDATWAVPAGSGFDTLGVIQGFNFATSSTVLQAITNLAVTIPASATAVYLVEVFLQVVAANTTMKSKWGWTTPTGMTGFWGFHGRGPTETNAWGSTAAGTASVAATAIGSAIARDMLANTQLFYVGAFVYNAGGNAGTLQFEGCQNVSDPGQLTVTTGFLRASKLVA